MVDRLSPEDVSFLLQESPATPMHVGSVAVLQPPPEGFDHARLVELIASRIALVPRFRQRVRTVPGRLANPVWVDDEDFDLDYHVRRSALPRPGSPAQLRELVARLQSRQLDRTRPLWEVYLVEGLEDGRVALVSKTHGAMIDGVSAVDIATVMLDASPLPTQVPADDWRPHPEPRAVSLVAGAVAGALRRPAQSLDTARTAVLDARTTASRAAGVAGSLLTPVRAVTSPGREAPLRTRTGMQRRFGTAEMPLEDFRRVREAHGGTVNDGVLAVIAGGLRAWLLTRGEPVTPATTVRAMVPVSVRAEAGAPGSRVSSYVVDLPVGEGSPVVRLHQVGFAMRGHAESGRSVGADTLVHLSGFAPPTMHSLGARVAATVARRTFDLVITNVPGPQIPMYAAGARLLKMWPVVPITSGQAVSLGVTSYDGTVCVGLNADRDAMPDVDVLAACLEDALEELRSTT